MNKYYIRVNEELESYQIMEKDGVENDGVKEDCIIADFYTERSVVESIVTFLNI